MAAEDVRKVREKIQALRLGFESARTRLRNTQLHMRSELDAARSIAKTIWIVLNCSPKLLLQQLQELDFVLERISKAESTAFDVNTWQDSVESWLALRDLLAEVESQKAAWVLETKKSPKPPIDFAKYKG